MSFDPAKWKLVPIEPDDDLLRRGVRAFQHGYHGDDSLADWRAFYREVLSAAPSAEGEPTDARDGWISVEEQRPDVGTIVLLSNGSSVVEVGWRSRQFSCGWALMSNDAADFEVTHWHPLPAPPADRARRGGA